MAVELPPRIDSFYRSFWRSAMLIALTTQVLIGLLIAGLVWYVHDQVPPDLMVYILIAAFLVLEIVTTWLVINTILKPTQIFASALAHISGEANTVAAPNINKAEYEKNGLKAMVQLIYQQAAKANEGAVVNDELNQNVLDTLPVGVIVMNDKREVIFYNKNAPVVMDREDKPKPELLFTEDNCLDSWLDTTAEKIADDRSWRGIANKLPEEEGRKLFDVIGSFRKNAPSGIETILVTINRDESYKSSEEDVDFIALAAHELRGPITVIRGYLDVLQDELAPSLNPDQYALLERLNVSASNLTGYINNILNVSRYDRRHLKLHLREMKLDDIYNGLSDDLALRAKTRNRLLSVNIPSDLPSVAADRSSIGEVITNFVDNAIKYSNEGGQILVNAKVDGSFVAVSVQDFGIGIPTNIMQSLFTKFYRSHRSRESVSGTGLGLYISKAIVQSHGGTIGVVSDEGQGSTFTFTLPIYATVADKLAKDDNENTNIIETEHGWIKNHNKYIK